MYITLAADYAVRITDALTREYLTGARKLGAAELSGITTVPQSFCVKILRTLVAGGVARSFKGAGGGYALAKNPRELTLLDVMELVQGDYKFSRCLGGSFDCSAHCAGLPCAYQNVFAEISDQVRQTLSGKNFADLCLGINCEL